MELKDAMIQAEEKLDINKQLMNKIINECNIADAYLKSKNVFKKVTMITDLKENEYELILLIWQHDPNQKEFSIIYAIEDELTGEILSSKPLHSCQLHIRTKMHPFLGDFIVHVANQTIKDIEGK